MPVITVSNRAYPVDKNQSLLDSLLAMGEKYLFPVVQVSVMPA